MTISTKTRALAMGGALALATSAVIGGGAANANTGATCTPTTRTLDASSGSWPAALGPAGHAVTRRQLSGTQGYLESVHAPDGTVTDIVDGDRAPWGADDINRRGVVAGTETYWAETGSALYQPWVFRRGHVELLASPGKRGYTVRKDYFAAAVNARSVVVGLKTNSDRYTATDPEYVARPVLWPAPTSKPVKVALPAGFNVANANRRLLDILSDGTITAVLVDGDGRYSLAKWATPSGSPRLRQLPDSWTPTNLAGQWVTGRIGTPFGGQVFVRSWTQAFTVAGPQPLYADGVSNNGTFTASVYDNTQTPTGYIGRPSYRVAQLGRGIRTPDVVGSRGGQVLVAGDAASVQVVTCALELPEAADIVVTPFALRTASP